MTAQVDKLEFVSRAGESLLGHKENAESSAGNIFQSFEVDDGGFADFFEYGFGNRDLRGVDAFWDVPGSLQWRRHLCNRADRPGEVRAAKRDLKWSQGRGI